jgi:GNAT superfamily N-acetyltransferase
MLALSLPTARPSSPRLASDPAPCIGRLIIKTLAPRDLPAVVAHFLAFELVDRCQRFHGARSDDALAAYVSGLDLERTILIGAREVMTGRIVGLAEAHLDDAQRPATAELSVSVLAPWRDAGLGRRLVRRALDIAFQCGARGARFHFSPDTRAMIRILKALGARVDLLRGEATVEGQLPLAA